MNAREKTLAAVVAGLLAVLVIVWLGKQIYGAFESRQDRILALEGQIRDKKLRQVAGQEAAMQLADWEQVSLPSNRDLARTLYQNWLLEVADQVKLSKVNIDAGQGGSHRNIYYKLPFTIRGRGSLAQATEFLHAFYSANHLHQVRSLKINPLEGSRELELNLSIEALVLPGADRPDALNGDPADRLALMSLDDYRTSIVDRNLFAQYTPPPPPRRVEPAPPPRAPEPSPPPPPRFDPSRFAVITAILQVGPSHEVWINVQTTGELLRLREGDQFEVGSLRGTIVHIGFKEIEIEAEGIRRELLVGMNLRQGRELSTGG